MQSLRHAPGRCRVRGRAQGAQGEREIKPNPPLSRISTGSPASPLTRYQHRVAGGELRADRSQLAAVRQLNLLHRALVPGEQKPGWMERLRKPRRDQCRGIYLWGGVGTGKTLLMDMFYHSLPDGLAHRIHYHRFMQSVHDAKSRIHHRQDPLAVIAAQLAGRCRVLCLDEFSVTDITDAMILSGLLHQLFCNDVVVVTTSNIHPDNLYRDGLQRQRFLPAIELIKAQTQVVKVDGGKDYRMDYLRLQALYHVPHDDNAARALRQSFVRLEGDMPEGDVPEGDVGAQKDALRLSGREVAIIAAGRGTAWFSFDALCDTNRSKVDYIELSKRFHTVILSDIPALDADMDDSTRRLIELIDELYDRGVNLIVSAARPPADLYAGKRLQQPFKRTVSRLREMASRDYLARPHLL